MGNNLSTGIDVVTSRILTSEEYARKIEAGEKLPSHFEIVEGDKAIHYYGARHTNDPESPMFAEIEQEMDKFKPDIVYVEGVRFLKNISPEKLAQVKAEPVAQFIKDGEAIYTAKLAIDRDIAVESPEPDFGEEIEYVKQQGFSARDVFSYYIFRVVYQYQNHFKNKEVFGVEHFRKYVGPHMNHLKEVGNWDETEFAQIQNDFWNELKLDDRQFYSDQVDPIPWRDKKQTKVNEVASASSHFRDMNIVEEIAKGLKNHNRAFIVYGSSHAMKQEPALRELLKAK